VALSFFLFFFVVVVSRQFSYESSPFELYVFRSAYNCIVFVSGFLFISVTSYSCDMFLATRKQAIKIHFKAYFLRESLLTEQCDDTLRLHFRALLRSLGLMFEGQIAAACHTSPLPCDLIFLGTVPSVRMKGMFRLYRESTKTYAVLSLSWAV